MFRRDATLPVAINSRWIDGVSLWQFRNNYI